jgi:tripartite-type tricarboxylate transporter receptor subunit TctC
MMPSTNPLPAQAVTTTGCRTATACGALAAAGLALLAPQLSFAQAAYPAKPVQFIVPYAPGGNGDIVARIVAQRLGPVLGQPMLVDNRAGAGGNIGAEAAAKAAPDGYTIMLGTNTHAINMSLYAKVNYDFARDFTPISMVSSAPLVLVVHPSVPAKSVAELVAHAKANPGKLNYGTGGSGSSGHIAAELFKTMTGTDIVHVPYKGVAQSLSDTVAGQLQMVFNAASTSVAMANAGKVRALGITSIRRSNLVPGVPTIAESGVPGFDASIWQGILAPAKTPPAIVNRLNKDLVSLLATTEIQDQFRAQGVDPSPSTPEEFGAYIRAEIPKWAKVVKASGAVVE